MHEGACFRDFIAFEKLNYQARFKVYALKLRTKTKNFDYFSKSCFQILVFDKRQVKVLNELRNCISRIICLWSLFCSIRVCTSLHFLPILLENQFFIILRFLYFLTVIEFNVIFINFLSFKHSIYEENYGHSRAKNKKQLARNKV